MSYYERPVEAQPLTVSELLELFRQPNWMERAACRTERAQTLAWTFGHRSATDLFVPPPGSGRRGMAEIVAARGLCEACPVRTVCLEFALENHPQAGMWGGTDLPQRIAMKKKEGHAR